MIELKNITKVYKSKKGLPTEALRGIDLTFSEKGLTFILGKSGSGKSTLLNILGGLDTYTSGDLVINGKSTKNFKESEWDAYRNTYMGFVFQEFNLLDNYTILDNMKLSLELQGKKPSEEEIGEALRQVDLDNILKRKPNELSGGQKQRVAIARALIKNPKIILADEPTGNLDSETSKDIFAILKKLSKDKLVIVVSHDEESAKKYADRIIKISDGKIIEDTNPPKKVINKEQKLVTAHLPFFYSLKMGLGNLFHKKIRLIFSFSLIVLCLICFGLMTSVVTTNLESDYKRVFESNQNTEIKVNKYEEVINQKEIIKEEAKHMFDYSYEGAYPSIVALDDDFILDAKNKTGLNWYGVYSVYNNFNILAWNYINSLNEDDNLYYYIGDSLIERELIILKANRELLSSEKIIGTYPTNEEEIIITSFTAEQIMHNGILAKQDKNSNTTTNYKPTSYNNIINDGMYINMGDMMYVKVVGIVDYSSYLQKYSSLKTTKTVTFFDMLNYEAEGYENIDRLYTSLINDYEFLSRVYVHDSFISSLESKEANMSNSATRLIYNNNSYDINTFGFINNNINVYTNIGTKTITSLNDNEIVINTTLLDIMTNFDYSHKKMEYELTHEAGMSTHYLNIYLKENNIIGTTIKTSINNNKIYNDNDNFGEYKIVGVVDDTSEYSLAYYSKNVVEDLISDNIVMESIITKVNTIDELNRVFTYYPVDNSDTISSNMYINGLLGTLYLSSFFQYFGSYGTIFFLVFASIILMNFISNSIKFRKKEIGILRALGCRSIDVIKMFLYECLALMIICLIASFMIIPNIAGKINNIVVETSPITFDFDLMHFGIIQVVGVASIMIIIVILATIIPMRKLTKTKPIDTILDK